MQVTHCTEDCALTGGSPARFGINASATFTRLARWTHFVAVAGLCISCASYRASAAAGTVGTHLDEHATVVGTSAEVCSWTQALNPVTSCDTSVADAPRWGIALREIVHYAQQLSEIGENSPANDVAGLLQRPPSSAQLGNVSGDPLNSALLQLAQVLKSKATVEKLRAFVAAAAPHVDALAALLVQHFQMQLELLSLADQQLVMRLKAPSDLRCSVEGSAVELCLNDNASDRFTYLAVRNQVRQRRFEYQAALDDMTRFRRVHRVFVSEFLASDFDDEQTLEHIQAALLADQ